MEIGNHKSATETFGAGYCKDCGAKWGTIEGTPEHPPVECDWQPEIDEAELEERTLFWLLFLTSNALKAMDSKSKANCRKNLKSIKRTLVKKLGIVETAPEERP